MKSYLKFLSRNKLYTAVEFVGLAVSLAFVVIIGSYVYQQWHVTQENPDRKDIYSFGLPNYLGLTYGFNDAVASRIPEVEATVKYTNDVEGPLIHGSDTVRVSISFTEKGFFDMFPDYHFKEGGPEALDALTNLLVSESFAKAHDIKVGQEVHLFGKSYMVAGSVTDFRGTLFPYTDLILNIDDPVNEYALSDPYDHYGSVIPFVKFVKGTDPEVIYDKVEQVCKEIYPDMYGKNFFEKLDMVRYDKIFFKKYGANATQLNHGDMDTLRILLVVGLLLLLSAIFNYVNLSFALAGKRSKEMAVRRLLGSSKGDIIRKYISESLLFTTVCFAAGIVLAHAFAPTMNTLLNDPDVPIQVRLTPGYWAAYAALVLLVGIITGAAPAALAGRVKPIDVIKGSFRRKTKMTFSKVFIIVQNAIAVVLIAVAILMEAQYRHSARRPLHANVQDRYYLEVTNGTKSQNSLRDALVQLPCVKRIGFSGRAPGLRTAGQYGKTRDGQDILYRYYQMDSTAFDILGFEIIKDYHTPKMGGVWFGKSAFEKTGFTDDDLDVSLLTQRTGGNIDHLAGVIEDVPTDNSNTVNPIFSSEDYMMVNIVNPERIYWGGWVMETVGDHKAVRESMKACLEEWSGGSSVPTPSFNGFVEDLFVQGLKPVRNNMHLLEVFMLVAVLISLLGLLAMSTYFAGERSKDIAIRKVFGGTVKSETGKGVVSYLYMVAVALVIGIPVAVWASGKYLERFIWKLEGCWWIFIAAAALSAAFAIATVLWQTLRAAKTDPATELKKE